MNEADKRQSQSIYNFSIVRIKTVSGCTLSLRNLFEYENGFREMENLGN